MFASVVNSINWDVEAYPPARSTDLANFMSYNSDRILNPNTTLTLCYMFSHAVSRAPQSGRKLQKPAACRVFGPAPPVALDTPDEPLAVVVDLDQ
jgi:hypothetical protein